MSIYEVAKLAGVSHTTVSRVINDRPGVSPERAKLIREAMESLAYTPKPRGRRPGPTPVEAIKFPRTLDVFALIAPELDKGLYPALQKGFSNAAAERGLQILACHSNNNVDRQANLVIQLIDKGVSGVAMVPATLGASPAHQVRLLQKHKIPVVLLHRPVRGITAPLITLPAEAIGRMAGKRMAQAGHKRVAFMATQRGGIARQYERGLRLALEAEGVELPDALVDYAELHSVTSADYDNYCDHVADVLHRMLKGPDAPTAVFSSSCADALYVEALRLGLSVPGDLSIVTVSGSSRDNAISQSLTSVAVDEVAVGEAAARLLDEMISGERPHDDTETFSAKIAFDKGETLGPSQ